MIKVLSKADSKLMKKDYIWIPEKGETVEIIGNIPLELKKSKKPILGTITKINGFYILVKPKRRRWEAEFYACELRPVGDFRIKR
jgi:hypothetical protein